MSAPRSPTAYSRSPQPAAAAAQQPHLLAPTHTHNTRSRSPSPAPPSPRAAPHSPATAITRSLGSMQLTAPTNGSAPTRLSFSSSSTTVVRGAAPADAAALDAGLALLSLAAVPVVAPVAALTSTTGLVYDARCLLHQANYNHVEKPARASQTMQLLKSSGLYQRCVHVPTRAASDDEIIGQAHTKEHVQAIDATVSLPYKGDELDSETEGDTTLYPDCKFLDSDTYVNRFSSQAARLAIGGLINLMDEVIHGRLRNGFAVIRPPGHHADCVKAQGFCLYNNVAVAVQSIRARHPAAVKRVLIVDWDVHHGNGTQNIFYNDPNVLYFSIHRYQGGAFYPHTGAHTECGGPQAPGSNINIPLNFKSMGDAEYLHIFRTVLLPIIAEFRPHLVVVSAGFDCAQGDPLGGMEVSSEGFGALTRLLMESVPHGRVVMALEGGYNVRAVSEAVTACTRALLGDPLEPLQDPYAFVGKRELTRLNANKALFHADLLQCIKEQKKYWQCMRLIPTPEQDKATQPVASAAVAAPAVAASAPAAASPASSAAPVTKP